jgi:hypothetical protein
MVGGNGMVQQRLRIVGSCPPYFLRYRVGNPKARLECNKFPVQFTVS